ncbi:protein kinase family protein [Catellatospora coxensis]|uniref:protein kinase family protein n=1 Tax=Catellatospora coxensis TaxID=310354 RepID=UPI003570CC36
MADRRHAELIESDCLMREDGVTQVGEGPRAAGSAAGALGELAVGDVLAERYRLEEHINDDSAGRQVWRGVDIVLRRPVALVLRTPGGASAEEMLSAAVTASRVVHGNLIGVYDAIDEGERAYVIREWIDGTALRDLVAEEGPFDAERTTSVLHAVADAVSALHASGMAHGNVHPGTVLVAADGRVVLADARVDSTTSNEADVRSLGALAYFMLTGHWPRAEAGRATALPDARRDSTGSLVAPRNVRAGVPTYLDDLVMDLLDPKLALPTAQVLTGELARLDTGERLLFGGNGTLRFADETAAPEPAPRAATPRLMVAGGVALALVVSGLVLAVRALNADATEPSTAPSPNVAVEVSATPAPQPQAIKLRNDQVRIVAPVKDRDNEKQASNMVDGNPKTLWQTTGYTKSNFGNTAKKGIGILITLDKPQVVSSVTLELSAPGASATLLGGSAAAPDSRAGDKTIVDTYQQVAGSQAFGKDSGTTMVFSTDASTQYQYLLVWITDLPRDPNESDYPYRVGVQEIAVEVQ